MHNFYAKYAKILDLCKRFSKNLVNELGNVPRRGVVPKFSDLEVIALSLTAESLSINNENCLFVWLNHHRDLIPNMISRRQFNTRRKLTISVCNAIRERIANEIDGGETFFCIDSKAHRSVPYRQALKMQAWQVRLRDCTFLRFLCITEHILLWL